MLPLVIEEKVRYLFLSKAREFNSTGQWLWRIRDLSEWSYVLDGLTDEEYDIVFMEMRNEDKFPSSSLETIINEVTTIAFRG